MEITENMPYLIEYLIDDGSINQMCILGTLEGLQIFLKQKGKRLKNQSV